MYNLRQIPKMWAFARFTRVLSSSPFHCRYWSTVKFLMLASGECGCDKVCSLLHPFDYFIYSPFHWTSILSCLPLSSEQYQKWPNPSVSLSQHLILPKTIFSRPTWSTASVVFQFVEQFRLVASQSRSEGKNSSTIGLHYLHRLCGALIDCIALSDFSPFAGLIIKHS